MAQLRYWVWLTSLVGLRPLAMQAVTEQDIAAGATYLKIMEENLEILKEALQ